MKHLLTKQCDFDSDGIALIQAGVHWRALILRKKFMRRSKATIDFLKYMDDELSRLWRLGRNAIIGWCPLKNSIAVLSVPQFLLPNILPNYEKILVGSRKMSKSQLQVVSDICEIEPYNIKFPANAKATKGQWQELDKLIHRYSIIKTNDKAVILFDIVGFSHYSALEQVTALNSLSYSINIAHRRAKESGLDIVVSQTTTGDGFYIWNENNGLKANLDLYCLMMLVLADNALSSQKSNKTIVPDLRTCFHVGSCYEYFQATGENLGTNHFIVGDVTIDLARMIDRALSGQILIGNFYNFIDDESDPVSTLEFIDSAKEHLTVFEKITLSRERVTTIKCYLTGEKTKDDEFNISRYIIRDKHDYKHSVYNAKVNIYRQRGAPIYLGRQSSDLENFETVNRAAVNPSESSASVIEFPLNPKIRVS